MQCAAVVYHIESIVCKLRKTNDDDDNQTTKTFDEDTKPPSARAAIECSVVAALGAAELEPNRMTTDGNQNK